MGLTHDGKSLVNTLLSKYKSDKMNERDIEDLQFLVANNCNGWIIVEYEKQLVFMASDDKDVRLHILSPEEYIKIRKKESAPKRTYPFYWSKKDREEGMADMSVFADYAIYCNMHQYGHLPLSYRSKFIAL